MSVNRDVIEEVYWDWVLTKDSEPRSVYALAKDTDWSEKDFYALYPSLEAVEARFWERLILETEAAVTRDDEYSGYSEEQKLLAFFFTFFEHILPYRSRFLTRFPAKPTACELKKLCPMRKAFLSFLASVGSGTGSQESDTLKSLRSCGEKLGLEKAEHEASWLGFLGMIRFWMIDDSEGFEATDALIEKSVRLGHALKDTRVLESALDLGRFLVGRLS